MFKLEVIDTDYVRWMLYSGRIGAIICCLITMVLFFHVMVHYRKLHRADHEQIEKYGYIIVLIYIITGFLTQAITISFRSNALSIIHLDTYMSNEFYCKFGYIASWIFGTIALSTLYIMFLYRIWVTFNGSVYEYSPRLLKSFIVLISLQFIVILSDRTIRLIRNEIWIIRYDKVSGLLYCFSDGAESHKIFGWVAALFYLTINAGLLYLFCRGLWRLKKQMTHLYITNNIKPVHHSQCISGTTTNTVAIELEDVKSPSSVSVLPNQNDLELAYSRSTTSTTTSSNESGHNKHQHEIELIAKLHELIKKQTILVGVSLLASFVFTGWASFDIYAIQQSGWILVINIICSWMMLASSQNYWNICIKYGLCLCCYVDCTQK